MQGLLIDHLVEHRDGENIYFSLTCTICGTVWKSAALPGLTRKAAAEEAAKNQAETETNDSKETTPEEQSNENSDREIPF